MHAFETKDDIRLNVSERLQDRNQVTAILHKISIKLSADKINTFPI